MILVVGARGARGRIVCERRLAKNHAGRGQSPEPENRVAGLKAQGAKAVQGDLRDSQSLRWAREGTTGVVSPAHAPFGRDDERSELEEHARSRLANGKG
ncbi:MAG: NmrA family NAD(P)-binding protein [Anaerolineae bacterium]